MPTRIFHIEAETSNPDDKLEYYWNDDDSLEIIKQPTTMPIEELKELCNLLPALIFNLRKNNKTKLEITKVI